MSSSWIFDNVFEAVHHLDPANPLYEAKKRDCALFRNNNSTSIMMNDGTWVTMPMHFDMRIYRGENTVYETCKAGLYRIKDTDLRCCLDVKRCDFELYVLEMEEIKQRIETGQRVDTLAIAQHYGFPTRMLDVTKDLIVAAFFATHRFNSSNGQIEPVEAGTGRIRWGVEISEFYIYQSLQIFGDQMFERPHSQDAMGVVLSEEDDFSNHGGYIDFYQSKEMTEVFDRYVDGEMIIPQPEYISMVATYILKSCAVSSMAIERYLQESGEDYNKVANIVKKQGLYIVDAPLLHPSITLPVPVNDLQMMPIRTERITPTFII